MNFWLETPILPIIFLLGIAFITIFSTTLLILGKFKAQEEIRIKHAKLFFFRYILNRFFTRHEWENLYLTLSFTKHLLILFYASSSFFFSLSTFSIHQWQNPSNLLAKNWGLLFLIALSIIAISIAVDFLMRLLAMLWSKPLLKISAPIASFYLLIFFPIIGTLLKVTRFFFRLMKIEKHPANILLIRDKIKELIRDSEIQLDPNEQKLISSFITFRERVAKEIMVPRIDMTALDVNSKLEEASSLFLEEGYSRIPLYRDSLDNIIGVLLYKDVLKIYFENEDAPERDLLNVSLESLVKPVIYTPENKKISQLLQEFRSQQKHLAIVVDEYGGTEGILTIEDILEELVGEIEDEYDFDEDVQFWKLPNGSWIVDAKMSIIDIESKLHIQIPHHPEYETIGGYIFHKAGTIPSKGWSIHHDEFDLEVLSSSERSIEKIRITPKEEPAS